MLLTLLINMFSCSYCLYTTNRKYNLDRHIGAVHKNASTSEGQNVNMGGTKCHQGGSEGVQNVIIGGTECHHPENEGVQNVIAITGKKCHYCYKVFSCQKSLKRHFSSCQNIENSTVCWKCNKKLSTRQSKSRHIKTCQGLTDTTQESQAIVEAKPETTVQTNIQTQNVQTQNNIQNQTQNNIENQNITNNVVVYNFPGFCDEDFDFDRDHISHKKLSALWDCSRPEIGFYKYATAILENPKNRYVRKTDAKANHSSIHVGDGEWELALDKDVFPRLTFDMSVSALGAYNDNKQKVRLMKTNLNRIFRFLDNVNTENDPDWTDAVQRLKLIVVNQTKKWEAAETPSSESKQK